MMTAAPTRQIESNDSNAISVRRKSQNPLQLNELARKRKVDYTQINQRAQHQFTHATPTPTSFFNFDLFWHVTT